MTLITTIIPSRAHSFYVQYTSSFYFCYTTYASLQVYPSEVWLRAENDNRAFFPDDSGHFNLHDADLLFGVVLGVEGPNLSSGSRLTVSSMAQSTSIGSSASYNSNPHLLHSNLSYPSSPAQRNQL